MVRRFSNSKLKRNTIFYISCLVLVISSSCKKENIEPEPIINETETGSTPLCDTVYIELNTLDTIYPSEYLAAYPGSWWNYSDGSTESCSGWEIGTETSQTVLNNCVTKNSDNHYFPRTTFGLISDKDVIFLNYIPSRYFPLIGGDYIGHEFYNYMTWFSNSPGLGGYNYNRKRLVNHFDSFEVNGTVFLDVIKIAHSQGIYFYDTNGGPQQINYYYYSRNIGLIRKDIGESPSGAGPSTVFIQDFYIAPL